MEGILAGHKPQMSPVIEVTVNGTHIIYHSYCASGTRSDRPRIITHRFQLDAVTRFVQFLIPPGQFFHLFVIHIFSFLLFLPISGPIVAEDLIAVPIDHKIAVADVVTVITKKFRIPVHAHHHIGYFLGGRGYGFALTVEISFYMNIDGTGVINFIHIVIECAPALQVISILWVASNEELSGAVVFV
jgi:hypothetical protein